MFLLIDNYDSFTYNLVQAFFQLGRDPVTIKNDDPALPGLAEDPSLAMVCISPGPGRPEQAGLCLEFLRRLPPAVPVLGVCLGHQILGHFAGARCEVADEIMHGKQSAVRHDGAGLFHGLANPMTVGRYHSLLVRAGEAPAGLTVAARTEKGEVMALRYADRPWTGVQFHPESVLTPDGQRLLENFPSALTPDNRRLPETAPSVPLPGQRGLTRPAPAGRFSGKAKTNSLTAPAALSHTPASPASISGAPPHTPIHGPASCARAPATPAHMPDIMELLAKGRDLTADQAAAAFTRLMEGELPPSQAGALLLGLRAKGETSEEVNQAVSAVLAKAVSVPPVPGPTIDIVGTGGDNKSSFNCSTAASLCLAGMGHKVLKHGNRSVSSRCGSADVLERLGITLDTPPEEVPRVLEEQGFVFLFAPRYHPAFCHVMSVRRELGVRTLFNILGPLVNPARPTHHLLGVADPAQLRLVAETLARSGRGAGIVLHGAGGYDEATTLGESSLMFVQDNTVRPARLDPAEYGFSPCKERELAVKDPEEAAGVLRLLLQGRGPKAMRDMLALNLGLALYLLRPEPERPDAERGYDRTRMASAMAEAKTAVTRGAGRRFRHA